jgi:hypothetical protein
MQAKTLITYLKQELIASQAFHTLGLGTTTLSVTYDTEQIAIEFIVAQIDSMEINKMWAEIVTTDRLQVHIVNFRQLLPSQVLGPFELGAIGGKQLTLVLEVTGVKDTPCKYISYSLYMEATNG